ncbi:flagellar hook protein FlgE [Pseudomonas citronellolis]|uniref:flagellar hook protein FlgE n=1 Tax=Pseudomonas citronellolis TaxID=53408 RepID=UPI000718AA43|nr:flagellar hook protein FlgE [Pseudomonas citronellolis]KRV80460.1 flagellar biosynthesis protein FlgE [Pseudomonas citronellolis]KRW75836.1 flagellar biosynthesis protein FlgE [Pseudomonas citronellolis]
MSFNISLTGLNAVSEQLDTVSNNIANVGTVGFKSSRTEFGSVYADSQAMGVEVLGSTQSISLGGSLTNTSRNLDLAISGTGFFMVKSATGETQYTRAGVFNTDNANYMVNASGQRLQGYSVDAAGNLQAGVLGDLQVKTASLPAKATDSLDFVANLDADGEVPALAFDPADASTYNSTYTTKVYDSQGKEHTLTQYFVKTADNAWTSHYYADGNAVGTQALSFDSAGMLNSPSAPFTLSVGGLAGGVNALAINVDYTGTTQYGSDFAVTTNKASGYASGDKTGLTVDEDGMVYVNYSNGQRLLQGQVVLASFVNPEGLRAVSGTAWTETSASGGPLVGAPGGGQFGDLVAGALEGSNVDLTAQLVSLMEGQRNYQANTKVLTTDKELTQALFGAV